MGPTTFITLMVNLICLQDVIATDFPSPHIYRPLLGQRVTLDGIVWDKPKGWQGRVLMPSGDAVYLDKGSERLLQGKLVRVEGVLSFKLWFSKGPSVSGIVRQEPERFSWLEVKMESLQVIDRAENAFPQLNKK